MGPYSHDEALDELNHHWGEAYRISHPEPGVWLAQRRDNRRMLTTADPDSLFKAISADYTAHPVPRDAS